MMERSGLVAAAGYVCEEKRRDSIVEEVVRLRRGSRAAACGRGLWMTKRPSSYSEKHVSVQCVSHLLYATLYLL
jgi:hypothetical protein